ncbi:MAG TPA: HAMP domain-containing sensor histidine kinase [Candidatus Bathyarchaeia archaeon]|nr:HAMP domain-containing sensor histidine kinase [Candidatus Bathyarchaeia archaeon]
MFRSAVIKLTVWYLLIIMGISLLFSITIYQAAMNEIDDRLAEFQSYFEMPGPGGFVNGPGGAPNHRLFSAYRNDQRQTANRNISSLLITVNILVFFGGGALSYLLARRTLRHIEQSHDEQSRFTGDASHELRTPLAAMKSELEVALRNPNLSKTEMHTLLKSNLEEVNKLTTLSKTLLQLSRLDHASLELEPVNLGTVASEVVQRYDKNASRINLNLPSEQLVSKANHASIEELLTILVDNALKYSPKNSKIDATLSRDGRSVQFSITNGGRGISTENLPLIFDRFYRANNSRNDSGSGLGLALAKEIVEIHKGQLSVTSAKNADTTFTFSLPLIKNN